MLTWFTLWVMQGAILGVVFTLIPDWDRWWHPWALAYGWPALALLTSGRCLAVCARALPSARPEGPPRRP